MQGYHQADSRAGKNGGYSLRMHGHSLKPYRKDEIDFLVAYVVPENAWYVFPMSEAEKHRSLKLYPGSQRKRSKVERYREAWEMLEFPGQKEKADHVSMIGL